MNDTYSYHLAGNARDSPPFQEPLSTHRQSRNEINDQAALAHISSDEISLKLLFLINKKIN